jgi:hypothetical protein
MARRLQEGLNDSTGSGEVDNSMGSFELFEGKFWQPDGVSESLRGLELQRPLNCLFIGESQ